MALRVRYFTRASKKTKIASLRARFTKGRDLDISANSGEQINPRFWNNKTGTARELAEYPEKKRKALLDRLESIKQHILSEYDQEPDKSEEKITSEWLAKVIDKYHNPGKYIQKGTSMFSYIQHFIDNSYKRVNPKTGNPVSYKMRREYQVTFNYLKEYAQQYGEPDFADIDLEFYNNFTALLRDEGLQTNTVGKKIQTLKIFLNAATEDGINQYQKYKSRNFRSVTEEADNIYLNVDELKQFYEYDLSSRPSLERVRDLFIVACWTGLRYSDLHQMTPDRIDKGLLMIKQTKTGDPVWIPLHSVVNEMLDKYDGKLPQPISNQKYNDYLKDAAKLAGLNAPFIKTTNIKGKRVDKQFPKHELISSHTARRSFCTNAYEMDIPTLTIMAISGHRTERAFLKYIKIDGKKHAEKMREMWQTKGFYMSVAK